MILAVKFYKDVPKDLNPDGLADDHPAEVIENCEKTPGPEWVLMSLEKYKELQKSREDAQ